MKGATNVLLGVKGLIADRKINLVGIYIFLSTESRLRMKEARSQPALSSAPEGRLRQTANRGPDLLASGAEGRIRAAEVAKYEPGSSVSEGKLRQTHASSGPTASASEGRVRGDVSSSINVPSSEARLRTQGRKFGGQGFGSPSGASGGSRGSSSLQDHVTVPPPPRTASRTPPSEVESISSSLVNARRKPSKQTEHNPFEEEASDNPFGEDFETEDLETNPFIEEDKNPFKAEAEDNSEALNPFKEEDDYDSSLNPFSE